MKTEWAQVTYPHLPKCEMWPLNFEPVVELMEKYPTQTHVHWLWKEAVETPNIWVVYDYTESESYSGTHTCRIYAKYDPSNKILLTNLAGCPRLNDHQYKRACKVCGYVMKGK